MGSKLTGFSIALVVATFHLKGTTHPNALRSCLWLVQEEPSMVMQVAHNKR